MKKNKYIIGFVLLLCVLFTGGWSGFMQSHGIKQTGSDQVTDGGFAAVTEGADILSGFDFTVSWTPVASVTINDADTFTTTDNNKGIYKAALVTVGKCYKVTIAGSTTAGIIQLTNTVVSADYITGFGTAYFIADNNDSLYLRVSLAATVDITTFTLQEVTFDNWTVGVGWAPEVSAGSLTGKANKVAGTASALEPTPVLTVVAGVGYEIVWTNDQSTSGKSINAEIGATNGGAVTSDATTTDEITASTTGNLKFEAASDWAGTVDVVTTKRIYY